uniref:Uncharacterized protein n=1 Tax=Tetraselmis sp. GSL018 TaxID=582737 RepID=A0A061SAC6_9CHLO
MAPICAAPKTLLRPWIADPGTVCRFTAGFLSQGRGWSPEAAQTGLKLSGIWGCL